MLSENILEFRGLALLQLRFNLGVEGGLGVLPAPTLGFLNEVLEHLALGSSLDRRGQLGLDVLVGRFVVLEGNVNKVSRFYPSLALGFVNLGLDFRTLVHLILFKGG